MCFISKRPSTLTVEKHGKYITALLMSQDVPSLEFRHFFKKDYLKEERSPMEFHREKYRKGKKKFLLTKWSKGLTFAGIRGSFWSTGVLVEAPLTAMAVTALCVVEAVITHTPAPSTWCEPQPSVQVTALCMAVTLALWIHMNTIRQIVILKITERRKTKNIWSSSCKDETSTAKVIYDARLNS